MQTAQVVTLKSGQQNASWVDSKSPMHSFELRHHQTAFGELALTTRVGVKVTRAGAYCELCLEK
jgi:hypothetical protein